MFTLYKLIIAYNNAILHRNQSFIFPYKNSSRILIKKLMKEGIVLRYYIKRLKNKKKYLKILLRNDIKGNFRYKKIYVVGSPTNPYYLSYKTISKLVKGRIETSLLLTSKGILTIQECAEQHLGGILICFFY